MEKVNAGKRRKIICFGWACLLGALVTGWAAERTWELPVMATWTKDPCTTVTLAWERHEAAVARVTYRELGAPEDAAWVVSDATPARRHVFTLRDLRPATRYVYTVSSADGYEASGRFWTAPADRVQPFTFVLHNDLQGGIHVDAAKAVSAGVVAANPDFVVSTGDLADSRYGHDYAAVIHSWNLFFECLREELAAFVFQPASGNHDEPENPDSFWHRLLELPDAHDYTLDVGPIRFVMVDSTEDEIPSRVAWLTRELQRAAYDADVTWVIPMFHRPPFSEGEREGEAGIREWWAPLFTRYEVGPVFSGHAHTYQRTVPLDGVYYLVSGGGGGWPYAVNPHHPSMAFATSAYHFVQFHVAGDVMRLEAKTADGAVFDRAEYRAHRHVRVTPAFPARGESCTIEYQPAGGPLAGAKQVTLHLGRDEFHHLLDDLPMTRDEASGVWRVTFTVPDSPKWNLAFCFFDPRTRVWHNNYTRNWHALLQREW